MIAKIIKELGTQEGAPNERLWIEADSEWDGPGVPWVDGYNGTNSALMLSRRATAAVVEAVNKEYGILKCRVLSMSGAMDLLHLADYIMSIEGEPSQPGSTAACALRLLKQYRKDNG